MTSTNQSPFYGAPPPPILSLTVEQDFKMRRIEDMLPTADKEDLITVFVALQRQNFILSNNLTQLLQNWNKPDLTTTNEVLSKYGISSETKN
jgi:hypothetical protein